MRVEVRGEGRDLLLVHGFGTSARVWAPLLPHLRGFRVWLLDLPGHGGSPWSPGALTLEALSEAIASLPFERAYGLGWSLGGLVLMGLARRFPERLAGLWLVASSPCFLKGPGWPGIEEGVLAGFREELRAAPARVLRRFAALQVQGSANRDGTLKGLLAALSPHCPGALEEGLDLLGEDLRPPPQGARFILGARDRIVPPQLAGLLRDAVVIEGAGHAPFLSHPRAFLEALEG